MDRDQAAKKIRNLLTDEEIEDLMALLCSDTPFRIRIIVARTNDEQVQAEAAGIARNSRKARQILGRAWRRKR